MTQRTKTVEYVHDCRTTSLASTTRHTFTSITLTLPETGTRTFRSVYLEVFSRENTTSGVPVTQVTLGVQLGAAATDDTVITLPNNSSGDIEALRWLRNATSYFNTNFGSGTTQTFAASVIVTGYAIINLSAKIVITYEYDDADPSAATRAKTVRIPLESATGLLTNSLAEIGTNQIPILTGGSGILPEASITVKDIWFEVFANNAEVSATNFNLNLALDAEGAAAFGTIPQTDQNANWEWVIWHRTDMVTTSAHAFKASSSTTSRFNSLVAILCVTYTYDHSSTTSVMNSLELTLHNESAALGGTSSTDLGRIRTKFFIEEPATITLAQSGVVGYLNGWDIANMSVNLAVGSQSFRTYSIVATGIDTGQHTMCQRIDSGGAQGAGVSLARGENTITIDSYSPSFANGIVGAGFCARLYLNYTSTLHGSGEGVHNHTTKWHIADTAQTDLNLVRSVASGHEPVIPETVCWFTHIGYDFGFHQNGRVPYLASCEVLSGETKADGWADLRFYTPIGSNNYKFYNILTSAYVAVDVPVFRRTPGDPNTTTRLDPEGARKYNIFSSSDANVVAAGRSDALMYVTYHAITVSCTRAVSGYTGTGASLTVNIYRDDTKEWLYQATTVSGGNYTFLALDNTINLFAEVYQDSTHVGRSAPFIAS